MRQCALAATCTPQIVKLLSLNTYDPDAEKECISGVRASYCSRLRKLKFVYGTDMITAGGLSPEIFYASGAHSTCAIFAQHDNNLAVSEVASFHLQPEAALRLCHGGVAVVRELLLVTICL